MKYQKIHNKIIHRKLQMREIPKERKDIYLQKKDRKLLIT